MKYFLMALIALIALACASAADSYTSRFDNVDIDQILTSKRLFDNYFKCLMDKGKCPPDGKELKTLLPDALKTNCAKCTKKQQEGTDKVLRFIVNNKPDEWRQLKEKYDPEDQYITRYREAAKARGITI